MSKQPEALWLAEALESIHENNVDSLLALNVIRRAGPELRRLHEEVEMQLQALKAARQLMESAYQINKKDQALLRQALEALEYRDGDGADQWKADTITAIRQHLEGAP